MRHLHKTDCIVDRYHPDPGRPRLHMGIALTLLAAAGLVAWAWLS